MGFRHWLSRLFGSSGEQEFDRAEEERDFEPRVDIDAVKADRQAELSFIEKEPNEPGRLSDPDAP
jgi:hypothetical protein